ncbi:heparan sulfate 2-O-sulfotransferase pipe isoform X8 [Drosophila pseudoobscura]|uniref:Heparan sulfate 2-O-sulfotransferase pipe isoform X8 n=2 Tax=pseudoobscura subgroup TaxID=32358 RepID=A0A6I8W2F7_DROPS|nr:heparan sulfate 2-O-sulfotransferase pipe isoform X8 [Drosophila pseudoobscura]
MSLGADRSYKMKLRDVENAFKYRRIPYPKRSVELIALLAISCTFFLFMHTNKLNSRLKEMEVKLQPSEFSALGLTSNHVSGHDAGKHDDINTLHGTYQYLKSTGQLRRVRPIYLNNTRFAGLEVIVFNRPTRVCTEQMMPLLRQLSTMNDMNVVLNGPVRTMNRTRTEKQQETEIAWTTELESGTLYIAHSNWLDFKSFGYKKPIYLSMVRDPIDRVVHDYYKRHSRTKRQIYRRMFPGQRERPEEWYLQSFNQCVRNGSPECQFIQHSVTDYVEDFKRQSLFFCGNHLNCLPFNSPHAVQEAKSRVEKEYSVVGTWEEKNITLTVLEKYVPRFFNHARFLYKLHSNSIRNRNRNNRKPRVDPDVREMVRRNFTNEYEFYYFCKQRLYKQYLALQLEDNLR